MSRLGIGAAIVAGAAVWIGVGWDRGAVGGGEGGDVSGGIEGLSPAEVVERIHEAHRARDYAQVERMLVEENRGEVMEMLRSIDLVIDSNRRLRTAAEGRYGGPMAETWNLAAMEDNLGPFSERIRVLGQRVAGAEAEVTLQEGRNVPLMHAKLEWVEGRWLYRAERAPRALVEELVKLARTLDEVRESVEQGAEYGMYRDGFVYRVLPQMMNVVLARDDGPMVATGGESE